MNDVLDHYHRFPALGCFGDCRHVDFPLHFSKRVVASETMH
jgi:hypothetical protein